jgi:hypothetical protein
LFLVRDIVDERPHQHIRNGYVLRGRDYVELRV